MKNEFKDLPLSSPEEIINSVYNGEKSNIKELEDILNKPIGVKGYLLNLSRPDELTRKLYGDNREYIMPPKEKGPYKNFDEVVGIKIGQQKNAFHKENIADNTRSAINNLLNMNIKNISTKDQVLIALFSQEGKKYTASLSKDGKSIEFDDADKVSAYLAARRFKDKGIDKKDALSYTAAIYNQSIKKEKWKEKVKSKKKFLSIFTRRETFERVYSDRYGEPATNLAKGLSDATIGYPTYKIIEVNESKVRNGEEVANNTFSNYEPINTNLSRLTNEQSIEIFKQVEEREKKFREEIERAIKEERERIERERERQEWIEFEKEMSVYEKQLIQGAFAIGAFTAFNQVKVPKFNFDELRKMLDKKRFQNLEKGLEKGEKTKIKDKTKPKLKDEIEIER